MEYLIKKKPFTNFTANSWYYAWNDATTLLGVIVWKLFVFQVLRVMWFLFDYIFAFALMPVCLWRHFQVKAAEFFGAPQLFRQETLRDWVGRRRGNGESGYHTHTLLGGVETHTAHLSELACNNANSKSWYKL